MKLFPNLLISSLFICLALAGLPVQAQNAQPRIIGEKQAEELLGSVVRVKARALPDARSNATLGSAREGSGDIIIGVGADPVTTHAELYRKLWSLGPAGTEVRLQVLQGASVKEIKVRSIDRTKYFRAKPTV